MLPEASSLPRGQGEDVGRTSLKRSYDRIAAKAKNTENMVHFGTIVQLILATAVSRH